MKIAWALWVVAFLVLETYAVFDHQPNDTLTQTTLHTAPPLLILAFLGWLSWHFGSRVWKNRKGRTDGL